MRHARRPAVVMLLLLAATACAAQKRGRDPYLGYVYPAGGRQGTTFEITCGGQALQGANSLYVTGDGVRAAVTRYVGAMGLLNRAQQEELARRLKEIRDERLRLFGRRAVEPEASGKKPAAGEAKTEPQPTRRVTLPDLPELRNLEQQSAEQLRKLAMEFLVGVKKRLDKVPIAETVTLQVSIDPGAAPGDREVRLRTPAGLTNPLRFEVAQSPEVVEPLEENAPAPAAVDLPAVLNGRITPGDVDRFRVRARKGQRLVVRVEARRLIPYLADAVPGWFQATVALRTAEGKEVAFADDYRFDPDPVLLYEVPQDGEYQVEIHDAIYRGRDDFVYRITAGELPFITRMFPLGGRAGAPTTVTVAGWNLPWERVQLDTQVAGEALREAAWRGPPGLSNPLPYAVDSLPECEETEPNDAAKAAQRITPPQIVNGRINRIGDVDVFRLDGRAGQEVVAEVNARRLGSPLDSVLRLTDASGKVLAWNDDYPDKETGLVTHHADSYLRARLPAAGAYYVQLSDVQDHGGEEYAYRLRLGPPQPDFALRVTPATLNVAAGRAVPLDVYAVRRDGFAGDIDLALKSPASGFVLSGGRLPAGRDRVAVTLTAPQKPPDAPAALQLEGRARIGPGTVVHAAVPAEDMMQAFAYRHLVPAQALLAWVTGFRRMLPAVTLAASGPVRLPAGGTARVQVLVPESAGAANAPKLELRDPPAGVSVQEVTAAPGSLTLILRADAKTAKVGYADNLIVEAFAEFEIKRPGGKATKQRVPLGALPAIPFEIVTQ